MRLANHASPADEYAKDAIADFSVMESAESQGTALWFGPVRGAKAVRAGTLNAAR